MRVSLIKCSEHWWGWGHFCHTHPGLCSGPGRGGAGPRVQGVPSPSATPPRTLCQRHLPHPGPSLLSGCASLTCFEGSGPGHRSEWRASPPSRAACEESRADTWNLALHVGLAGSSPAHPGDPGHLGGRQGSGYGHLRGFCRPQASPGHSGNLGVPLGGSFQAETPPATRVSMLASPDSAGSGASEPRNLQNYPLGPVDCL